MNYSSFLLSVLLIVLSVLSPTSQPRFPANTLPAESIAQAPAAETSGYWLEEAKGGSVLPGRKQYDTSLLSSLTTVSLSPSGRYIASVDRLAISLADRNAAGVPNSLGRMPDSIQLFARLGSTYVPYKTIPVDREAWLEVVSMLGGGSDLAWNEDETRCVISVKWGANSEINSALNNTHSNLFLLDIRDGAIQRLTDNTEPGDHCSLPVWTGDSSIRFLRTSLAGYTRNSICEIDLISGAETKTADLYDADGRICTVGQWQAVGQNIYYILESYSGGTGFYVSPIGGRAASARCLIDLMKDLRETKKHPYCKTFGQMDISADGRWACLTVSDMRALTLDFPTADNPQLPQSDPAKAVSLAIYKGQPWVPCHNVFLYDLAKGKLVNPFTGKALAPAKAVVTGACFAPDGQSLLCAVFGDGGAWSLADYTRTTFYQIDLGSLQAIRVFETELSSSVWFPEGMRWLPDDTLCIPTGNQPLNAVQLFDLR